MNLTTGTEIVPVVLIFLLLISILRLLVYWGNLNLRMKRYLVFILCLFLTQFGAAQSNVNTYELKIDFDPAFINSSQVVIQSNGNSAFLNIKIFDGPKEHILKENNKLLKRQQLKTLEEFLQTYQFRIKGNIDTIGEGKELNIKGDSIKYYTISAGLDGITVKGTQTRSEGVKSFAFWSPKKGTANAELISILNKVLAETFIEEDIASYLENLEQYFPHKLGLKKISTTPLTYKLYGSISDNEAEELYGFLENLPAKEKVIIDLSNFGGMGTMFYGDFEEYCVGKKNIYWLKPSPRVLAQLHEIGIKNKYIISKRKVAKGR